MNTTQLESAAGAAVYNKAVLAIYDFYVLQFSNLFAWRCSAKHILDFYNEYVSPSHLDVGVGTGYFLDHCRFPSPTPKLTLLDLNPNSLKVTAERLKRYQPNTHLADILKPLPSTLTGFQSIGLNYVLHCLPGTMQSKGIVFEHLKPCLTTDGVLFGSTILGQGVDHTPLGKILMNTYNNKGIFGNRSDNLADLQTHLKTHFRKYTLDVEGCVACFVGWV